MPVQKTRERRTIDRYEVHEAVRTLADAERIKGDGRLMREVGKTMAAVSKAAGGPPRKRK